MVSARKIIVFAVIFQSVLALVEFLKSTLYDETDFAVSFVDIPTYGSRFYVSVPVVSVEIAKKLILHDYIHDEISFYDISKLKNGNEKSFYKIQSDILQVRIRNMNPGNATAPIAVWVVREDANGYEDTKVYEAATLNMSPSSVTSILLMSAEPFALQTKTNGPMRVYAKMAGYDEMPSGRGDDDKCTNIIDQMDPAASSDIQVWVQSPIITLCYDGLDYTDTMTSISADVGKGQSLDFSGLSFAASPGYTGCQLKGQKTYRSSLYNSFTSFKYSNSRSFDVSITSFLNTDNAHPVTVKDNTNKKEYTWSGTTPDNTNSQNITLRQTNNLEISWTRNERDLDQSFLIRMTP